MMLQIQALVAIVDTAEPTQAESLQTGKECEYEELCFKKFTISMWGKGHCMLCFIYFFTSVHLHQQM